MTAAPCPECLAGKHDNCDGRSWSFAIDAAVICPCARLDHGADVEPDPHPADQLTAEGVDRLRAMLGEERAKPHGDFGDMTRYDLTVEATSLVLRCRDCDDRLIADWRAQVPSTVALAEVNRAAAEHEAGMEKDNH